jgi:hypothetical protein
MIKISDIQVYHQSRPFDPFDIRTSDGRVYSVEHPEFLSLTHGGHVIFYVTDDDRLITIATSQIVALEKMNSPRAA